MFKDRAPNYTLGFGIPQSGNPLDRTPHGKEREGLSPDSGIVGRALYGHPIAKFFTVSAATMIGTAVGSAMIRRGGVRLGERLGSTEIRRFSTLQTSLNHQWRRTQHILDEWEGVDRLHFPSGQSSEVYKRAGYHKNLEDRNWLRDNELEDDGRDWLWRDEIQQRLVHQARSLPYQLPALYVANRGARTLVGDQNSQVNWKNPIDVFGDFAHNSVNQMASLLAPAEIGQGSLKFGWRKMMNDGDFVSNTQPFSNFKDGLIGVKSSLDQLGQDSLKLINETTRRSSQVAGSFAHALTESQKNRKPVALDIQNNDSNNTRFRTKRARLVAEAHARGGNRGAIQEVMPSISGFARGFRNYWNVFEEDHQNTQAIRRGDPNGDISRIHSDSYLAKTDRDLTVARDVYGSKEQRKTFKSIFEEEFAKQLHGYSASPSDEDREIASRITQASKISLPKFQAKRLSDRDMIIDRFNFGIDPIDDINGNWEEETKKRFGVLDKQPITGPTRRLGARVSSEAQGLVERHLPIRFDDPEATPIPIAPHAQDIIDALPEAMRLADQRFRDPDFQTELNDRIEASFRGIRTRAVIPEVRRQLGEAKLRYSDFGENAPADAKELLTRRTAEALGMPIQDANGNPYNTAEIKTRLRAGLARKGRGEFSTYEMRGILLDKGHMTSPWSKEGFNFLGLRPLTFGVADKQGYFGNQRDSVKDMLDEAARGDHPYLKSMVDRPVGPHVWESRSGNILDLNPTIQGFARTVQNFSRHVQLPFLHFSPADLTSFKKLNDFTNGPSVIIKDARDNNFGYVNEDLPSSEFDSHVWVRGSKGNRGRGKVIGYRDGKQTRTAEGEYYAPDTTGHDTWAFHMRLGMGSSGHYDPDREGPGKLNSIRRIFTQSIDQSSSIPNLFKRLTQGELPGRLPGSAGKTPNVQNTAILARWLRDHAANADDQVTIHEDEITAAHMKGIRNFEQEHRSFQIPPAVIRGFDDEPQAYAELSKILKIEQDNGSFLNISDIRDPHQLRDLVAATIRRDKAKLDILSRDDPEKANQVRAAMQQIEHTYLRETPEELQNTEASRAVTVSGINVRMDEMKGEIYKYLVAKASVMDDNPSVVIANLIEGVDRLATEGQINAVQRTEARAAILAMQIKIDGLNFNNANSSSRAKAIFEGLRNGPTNTILDDVANYNTKLIHHRRAFGLEEKLTRSVLKIFGTSKQSTPGFEYNPFGDQEKAFVPTFQTNLLRNPLGTLLNAGGVTTWRNPKTFSSVSVRSGHMVTRLNTPFRLLGLGVDESAFAGPMGMLTGGYVGRRIFPLVAGSALLMGIDRELGGLVHGKDENGNREYKPLVSGAVANLAAHGAVLAGGVTGGREGYETKKEQYFGEAEVPIRKGRYWPLGNQPLKGGRIQYFRPNWYKRFMSGYQYTKQDYGSPAERLTYDYDFSPLHMVAPYHYEKKHYADRPYPVTGDLFTGPWGPLDSMLNSTVGRVVKPHKLMHQREFNAAMNQDYRRVGDAGMSYIGKENPYPKVLLRATTGGASLSAPTPTDYYLGRSVPYRNNDGVTRFAPGEADVLHTSSGTVDRRHSKKAKYSNNEIQPRYTYSSGKTGSTSGSGHYDGNGQPDYTYPPEGTRNPSTTMVAHSGNNSLPARMNDYSDSSEPYVKPYDQPYGFVGEKYGTNPEQALESYRKGGIGSYVTIARGRNFDPRVIQASNPVNPGDLSVQAGQFGYEAQEMGGIYGFALGSTKQIAGFGSPNYTPDKPVLQQSSRAYGSERSFWDMNLGGFGDFPTPLRGEYGNLEFSEIGRRFIPHRRHDINELNPIPNQEARQNPWLPGSDYYTNFQTGDPYIAVPEGEMRLPGAGYERTHKLHSDMTGKYGMLDKQRILGDVAPWSEQYKAVDRIIRREHLTDEQKAYAQTTRDQVAAIKKRHNFKPYKYAHADFEKADIKVTGFMPGDADKLITNIGVVQLAGVRARKTPEAQRITQSLIHKGDTVSIRYDANMPTKYKEPTEAIITASNGEDLGQQLLKHDEGTERRKNDQLNNLAKEGPIKFGLHAKLERLGHANTLINQKFVPNRSAPEDWERYHVYGTDFPQWTHPIQDFIEPLGQRARNRNPLYATAVLSVVGRAFGRTPQGKTAGAVIGGLIGFGLSASSNAKTLETGQRSIPKRREKELNIDEYSDILNYVKYTRLYQNSRQEAIDSENSDPEQIAKKVEEGGYKKHQFTNLGPHTLEALQYRKEMKQTEYGADIFGDIMQESAALPKRKRDYFMPFINSPNSEHARILSTAPRLERRMYEARWGMAIENKPELPDYFSNHELPDESWKGWSPDVNMDDVRIKMIQQQGLEASQMGYFPQQVQQANLLNSSYPDYSQSQSHRQAAAQLQKLMGNAGVNGTVTMRPTRHSGTKVNLQMGVLGG